MFIKIIDDIAFKKKANAFWSVGALQGDDRLVSYTIIILWDFLLS